MSATPSWFNETHVDYLPDEYKTLYEIIGFDNLLKVIWQNQGTSLYFPRLDSALCHVRNEIIRKEFTGKNHRELAIKYGLTERWVYHIIKNNREKRRT